jgi:feruloyl esterase
MQQELGGPIARAKLAAVTAAANAACSIALTGQPDGYISDPSACRYDPTTDTSLLCVSAGGTDATSSCLTMDEASAVNKIWYGPTADGTVRPPATDNGQSPVGALGPNQLWFGLGRGTLLAGHIYWDGLAGQIPSTIATDSVALALGNAAFAQPNFVNATGNGQNQWRTIGYTGSTSFAEVFAASQQRLGDLSSTSNPDITAFRNRGGKLLMWHGTADSLIFPQGSINYYEAVAASAGGYAEAQKFARFYLAPGIDHCMLAGVSRTNPPAPGGRVDNPNAALIEVLQGWVENGEAPDQIAATSAAGVTPVRKRPWCLYPKKLKYVGGDLNTGNFTCD